MAQINRNVTDLERMTQQNAALVEQSAAAAKSMSSNAGSLGQTLELFKLP